MGLRRDYIRAHTTVLVWDTPREFFVHPVSGSRSLREMGPAELLPISEICENNMPACSKRL